MKKLPEYLDNILIFMAEEEEKQGGMKKPEAYRVFREELFNEALTAKANPSLSSGKQAKDFDASQLTRGTQVEMEHTDDPNVAQRIAMDHLVEDPLYYEKLARCGIEGEANPTIVKFHEIYDVLGPEFASSPLGKVLRYKNLKSPYRTKKKVPTGKYKPDGSPIYEYEDIVKTPGNELFEEIRQLSVNVADLVLEKMYSANVGRNEDQTFMTSGLGGKNIYTKSSGEYPSGLTRKERKEDLGSGSIQNKVEEMRYRRLLIETIVAGLLEPIFDLKTRELDSLLYVMIHGTSINQLAKRSGRLSFVRDVFQLMDDRDGIVKASLDATEYIGKESVLGGKIPNTLVNQLAEIYLIKTSGVPAQIDTADKVVKKKRGR